MAGYWDVFWSRDSTVAQRVGAVWGGLVNLMPFTAGGLEDIGHAVDQWERDTILRDTGVMPTDTTLGGVVGTAAWGAWRIAADTTKDAANAADPRNWWRKFWDELWAAFKWPIIGLIAVAVIVAFYYLGPWIPQPRRKANG